MNSGLRFESIGLDYGCHHGRFRLSTQSGPTVIVGSNGSGKSTLVEAIVRTLFGFNRQKRDARRQQEQRRPWKGGQFRAALTLRDDEGTLSFERDFHSNEVIVVRPATGEELYRGEANPAAPASEDQRRYRALLGEVVGLVELGGYERTACIQQGHMIETRLTEDLLKVAAGGHSDVERAKEVVSSRYRELTLAPISAAERKRRKPGLLEELESEVERLDGELRVARSAEADRAPLVQELRELEASLEKARSEVRRLEKRRDGLSRVRVLEERADASGERIRRLEGAQQDLREAIWKAEEASARIDGLYGREAYPGDYLERLAALEEGLWPHLESLERRRQTGTAGSEEVGESDARSGSGRFIASGIVLFSGGALASALGWAGATPGLLAAIAGLGLLILGLWRRRNRRSNVRAAAAEMERLEADLASVRARIAAKLDGLPDRDSISPATLAERRSTFGKWRSAWESVERCEHRLREARLRAERAIGATPPPVHSEPSEEALATGASRALITLERTVSAERSDTLAPTKLALERERATAKDLPDDVSAAFREVDERLSVSRSMLATQQERERDLRQRLGALPRPAESSVALEERRSTLSRQVVETRAEAAAYRKAYRLLTDAYDEFRETDQERLLEHVDRHLASLGGGKLGPLSVPDDLDSAGVLYGGRPVELSSPPLSYGELHGALFAVRLGAADFLAGMGVRLPLLVDDPFVHLDAENSSGTWEALRAVARERQVLVTTQDRLVLEHLGVRADLDLDGAQRPATAQMELPVTGL